MSYELQVGEQLDHYRLEELVSRTSTALIFRSVDVNTGEAVAIKVPDLGAESDPVFFSRFQREGEIGKRLHHPSLVKVMTNGEQSRPYLVMEWLGGRSLRKLLDAEHKLLPERAVRIAVRICDALDHIHGQGVVHRDLKPENVMVGCDEQVKLFDFGIAGMVGARRLTFSKFTPTLGTPDYISPEQVRGKRGDARSDIYALGVMLYEMVTGTVPFDGPNPLSVMHARLVNDPKPPCEIDPNISKELQEVICRAVEREPQKRYARARDMAWELQNLDQVHVTNRTKVAGRKRRRSSSVRLMLSWVLLAMIPILVFALLLLVARH